MPTAAVLMKKRRTREFRGDEDIFRSVPRNEGGALAGGPPGAAMGGPPMIGDSPYSGYAPNLSELEREFPEQSRPFLISILETTQNDLAEARTIVANITTTAHGQSRSAPRHKRTRMDEEAESHPSDFASRTSDDTAVVTGRNMVATAGSSMAAAAGPNMAAAAGPKEQLLEDTLNGFVELLKDSASIEDARTRLRPVLREWVGRTRLAETLRKAVISQASTIMSCRQKAQLDQQRAQQEQAQLHAQVRDYRLKLEEAERGLHRLRETNALLSRVVRNSLNRRDDQDDDPFGPFESCFQPDDDRGCAR
ncbi:hypothetical protein GNI_127140 [Gregarina niphandrodes]|uniref:CUE domain-containing protein n=1 Tax=Gregarina niphandrodes TaxID=110365 RepID=A0A023B210_GRENI|nr:hypothetical protein GNI_127140 [Gregarina niphandrodes]EZG49370.1 hypothetical protein GNI_127140 [Gregarina niphandrodes]|eukprot:XP_011132044.1 hypothetical protein GNI_127140 [Gregarina niphandrodes]